MRLFHALSSVGTRKPSDLRRFALCSITTPAHDYDAARARMTVHVPRRPNTQQHWDFVPSASSAPLDLETLE